MIHKTLTDAQRYVSDNSLSSWRTWNIVRVELKCGITFWRTYLFDVRDKCKRCNGITRQTGRAATSGHTCDQCGNPFAGASRRYRSKIGGKWQYLNAWKGIKGH